MRTNRHEVSWSNVTKVPKHSFPHVSFVVDQHQPSDHTLSSDQLDKTINQTNRLLLFKYFTTITSTNADTSLPFLIRHHSDSSSPGEDWLKLAAAAQM